MLNHDPIKKLEEVVKDVHDTAGKYTEPVLRRYPMLFAFLIVFSTAAIFTGFEFLMGQVPLSREKPIILITLGILTLFLTGKLFKFLEK